MSNSSVGRWRPGRVNIARLQPQRRQLRRSFVISLSQCGFVSSVKTLGGPHRLLEVLDRPFFVPGLGVGAAYPHEDLNAFQRTSRPLGGYRHFGQLECSFLAAQIVGRERCVTKASSYILPGIRPCEHRDKLVELGRCAGICVSREGTRKLAGRRNITVRVRNQLNCGGYLIQHASIDLDLSYRGKRLLLLMQRWVVTVSRAA